MQTLKVCTVSTSSQRGATSRASLNARRSCVSPSCGWCRGSARIYAQLRVLARKKMAACVYVCWQGMYLNDEIKVDWATGKLRHWLNPVPLAPLPPGDDIEGWSWIVELDCSIEAPGCIHVSFVWRWCQWVHTLRSSTYAVNAQWFIHVYTRQKLKKPKTQIYMDELHTPSSKGTILMLQVIKAIINQSGALRSRH